MIQRSLSPIVTTFSSQFPVIGITGPRQSGKTTLAKMLFPHLPHVSLENIDVRQEAHNDPRGFLKKYEHGAIFDEVQNAPDLLSYLQGIVDESRQKGRYVITGSQHFALTQQISQSLAGRIGMVTLLPLSLAELGGTADIMSALFRGGYPRLHDEQINPSHFYASYIQTYLERDVRQLKNIGNLGQFQTFLKLCAGRIGQIVNFSSLAQDCGISNTTARQWLTILEASYLVFTLQPFYKNFSKRLVKMPKIYFYDTGLACALLGIEHEQQLETHYLRGGLYENLAILELLKARFNRGLQANLYFWRDHTGHEVDCIAEWGGIIRAIEIKSSQTFQPDFVKNAEYFCHLTDQAQGYLIYNGTIQGPYKGIQRVSINDIASILDS